MLRYAIPEYRLPKQILNREIEAVLSLGIDLKLSTSVGRDIPWMQLVDEFDMVFLAVGAPKSAPMRIPEEDLEGVQGAVEFLRAVQSGNVSCSGERVAVIGGGDSAIDAARTALRLGASGVHMLYRRLKEDMPAQRDEIEAALEEGIEIEFLVAPTEFSGSNGRVEKLVCQRLELGAYDKSGRRRPVPAKDSSFEMDADRVLVAVGQTSELPFRGRYHGILVSPGGWVPVAEGTLSRTTNPKVYTGGDVTTGPATVAEAIAAGFRAAEDIDRTLRIRNGEPPYTAPDTARIDIPMEVPEETEEAPRERMRRLSVRSRRRGFAEVEQGYSARQAVRESGRCLRCDIQIETETEVDATARLSAGT